MGGEVVGINTETFDGNKTAIKEAKTFSRVKVLNIAIFPLTLLQMQGNTHPISWHFLQQYWSIEMVIL